MSKPFVIAGYAAPYGQSWNIAPDIWETVQNRAILTHTDVTLLWGGHHGPALANNTGLGRLELWNDDYGLAFRAVLEDAIADDRLEQAFFSGRWQASVNYVNSGPTATAPEPFRMVQRVQAGALVRTIQLAKIDHIAIVPEGDALYGDATAAWRPDLPDEWQPQDAWGHRTTWAKSYAARVAARAEQASIARMARANPSQHAVLKALANGSASAHAAAPFLRPGGPAAGKPMAATPRQGSASPPGRPTGKLDTRLLNANGVASAAPILDGLIGALPLPPRNRRRRS